MPITLSTALPLAATLGAFTPAIPLLTAMPGAYGVWDTDPNRITVTDGRVSAWASHGNLTSSFVQDTASLRPSIDGQGRVSMDGTARLDLAGVGTVSALTLAFRFSGGDTGAVQTIFAGTGNSSNYFRSFWQPTLLRTRVGAVASLRDMSPPPAPLGVVYVISGNQVTVYTGGTSLTWTSDISTVAVATLIMGAQTVGGTTDSQIDYSKIGVWKSALTGSNLANARTWVGA